MSELHTQGDLESRGGDVDMGGKLIGDLSFSADGSNTPLLIIGHHILYGKIVNLDNPMVVMHKCDQSQVRSTLIYIVPLVSKYFLLVIYLSLRAATFKSIFEPIPGEQYWADQL